MTGVPRHETERRQAAEATQHRATERYRDSAFGMRSTASELRAGAAEMPDTNDRATMLRLAADYDRRADDVERRVTLDPAK